MDTNEPMTPGVFDELIHYLKYASSAYTPLCPKPNSNILVTHFADPAAQIVEGYIARDAKRRELIVALRGSASVADILLDGQVVLVPFLSPGVTLPSEARVHGGFLTAWNAVAVQVLAILTQQMTLHRDTERLVTCGHSLGGSLAVLAAISLQQTFPQCKILTYSYGAPRTGNKTFAEFVNKFFGENAFRVVHTQDGVPTMIPRSLGYHHHGIEYWQTDDPANVENIIRCSADGEDPNCSLSIPSGGVNEAHLTYMGIGATSSFCW